MNLNDLNLGAREWRHSGFHILIRLNQKWHWFKHIDVEVIWMRDVTYTPGGVPYWTYHWCETGNKRLSDEE